MVYQILLSVRATLFLLVGGEELQKLIKMLPEQPTNYELHIQELNNHFEAHRKNTSELCKFFNIDWPTELLFADFETKCREQGLHCKFPITTENAIIMRAVVNTQKWRATQRLDPKEWRTDMKMILKPQRRLKWLSREVRWWQVTDLRPKEVNSWVQRTAMRWTRSPSQDGTVWGTRGPRAAQADWNLSYVALDVQTKPTKREFPVLLGVRTASGPERAIILLGCVPTESRIILVGKLEL